MTQGREGWSPMGRKSEEVRFLAGFPGAGRGVGRSWRPGAALVLALFLAVAGGSAFPAAGFLSGPAVARAQPQPELPAITVRLVRLDPTWKGDAVLGEVLAEVADEPEEQRIGLMERTELAPGRGMLFIWPTARPVSMWMRYTRIPLDMVFADGLGRIVRITRNVPPCPDSEPDCPVYPSGAPVRYVLELPAGDADRLGLREGDWLLPAGR